MYLADTHMHSSISPDSHASRAEMVRGALERGLDCVCFTDHYDVIGFDGSYQDHYDWPGTRAQHREALEAAAGTSLRILYGLELGNASADFAVCDRILSEPGLDFVIGSVHNLSRALDYGDLYDFHYTSPELCYRHLDDYLTQVEELSRWGHFDVLGHLPYPLRYMRERDRQPVSLEPFEEWIRAVLAETIAAGRGIEVNSKNFSPTVREDYRRLLNTYRELGGELVTVGADAHAPAHVGAGVAEAYDLLRECGFSRVAIYQGRKPRFITL